MKLSEHPILDEHKNILNLVEWVLNATVAFIFGCIVLSLLQFGMMVVEWFIVTDFTNAIFSALILCNIYCAGLCVLTAFIAFLISRLYNYKVYNKLFI